MSSSGGYAIGAIAAAPLLLILAAAGVTYAVAKGLAELVKQHATAGNALLNAADLEDRIQSQAMKERQLALHRFLTQPLALSPILSVAPAQAQVLPHDGVSESSPREASDLVARASALESVLRAEPVLAAVAKQWSPAALTEAREARRGAADLLERDLDRREVGQALELATLAESKLTLTVHDAFARLAQAQTMVVGNALAGVLTERRYAVRRAEDGRGLALWAERPDLTLAAVVDGGRTQLDLGADGLACTVETAAIAQAMRERGFEMRQQAMSVHGRREGGVMIQEAGRRSREAGIPPERALLETGLGEKNLLMPQTDVPHNAAAEEEARLARARTWLWAQRRTLQGTVS